jgi:hypothetical protein
MSPYSDGANAALTIDLAQRKPKIGASAAAEGEGERHPKGVDVAIAFDRASRHDILSEHGVTRDCAV